MFVHRKGSFLLTVFLPESYPVIFVPINEAVDILILSPTVQLCQVAVIVEAKLYKQDTINWIKLKNYIINYLLGIIPIHTVIRCQIVVIVPPSFLPFPTSSPPPSRSLSTEMMKKVVTEWQKLLVANNQWLFGAHNHQPQAVPRPIDFDLSVSIYPFSEVWWEKIKCHFPCLATSFGESRNDLLKDDWVRKDRCRYKEMKLLVLPLETAVFIFTSFNDGGESALLTMNPGAFSAKPADM